MPVQGLVCRSPQVDQGRALNPAAKSRRGTWRAAAGGKLHLLLLALLLGLCAHVIHADDPAVAVLIPGEVVEGFLAPKVSWFGKGWRLGGGDGRRSRLMPPQDICSCSF